MDPILPKYLQNPFENRLAKKTDAKSALQIKIEQEQLKFEQAAQSAEENEDCAAIQNRIIYLKSWLNAESNKHDNQL